MVAKSERCRLRLPVLVALLMTLVPTGFAVSMAAQAPRGNAADRPSPERVRREIEARFRVAPVSDGVVLVPRRENKDIQSIEVRGDTIAVNGTPVMGGELRERLKGDADPILALSYMDPDARRALFQAGTKAGTPPSGTTQPESPESQPAAPAPAPSEEQPSTPRRTVQTDSKVHIFGDVQVGENEYVDGPVVAILGSVDVNGEVREDVVAVGGNVRLGPKARVRGDVTAVGGTIETDSNARVEGKTNEVRVGRFPHVRFSRAVWLPRGGFLAGAFGPWVELMASLFRMVLFGLLAFLVFLLARNPIARIEHAVAVEPWKAGLVGVLTQLLFVPVFVLTIVILAISIIGIPLLLFVPPLALLGLFVALLFGFTAIASNVGQWIERRFGWSQQGAFVLLLTGLLAIWGLTILGRVISLGGWPIWFLSSALLVVGFLVEYLAWTVGLGAAVMTRLGTRPAGGGPPPIVTPASGSSPTGATA